MVISLESLETLEEIIPKDILCVLEKYSDVMLDSLSSFHVPETMRSGRRPKK